MKNIKMKIEGHILHIEVDMAQEVGLSSSGKSMLIATTGGGVSINQTPYSDEKVNISVYKKP